MQPSPTEAFNGWYQALLEGRVPFDLLPEWKLATETVRRYKVLILPSQTCLRQESLDALKEFVANGGGLVACFEAGTKNLWGEKHDSGKWSELMGVLRVDEPPPPLRHCYLRILEQQRSHPLLNGFDNTDILPGATYLSRVEKVGDTEALCDFVPTYPVHPPEKVYPDPKQTGLPLLFCRERNGRSVYLAMDFDAAFWRSRLPDHKRLLLNAVNWVRKGEPLPVTVSGNGLLDVTIWRQERSITVHLVNLNTPNLFGGPVTELLPVGEQWVRLPLSSPSPPQAVRLLRAKVTPEVQQRSDGWWVKIPKVVDHEILVVE